MKVNVKGKGIVSFPDTMTKDEILGILKNQFRKDLDFGVESLKAVKSLVENNQLVVKEPVIVKEQVIVKEPVQVERIIEKPVERIVEKQVIVEKLVKPKSWTFTIERDDDGITTIRAVPDK